jgi:hypothetical protein
MLNPLTRSQGHEMVINSRLHRASSVKSGRGSAKINETHSATLFTPCGVLVKLEEKKKRKEGGKIGYKKKKKKNWW